MKTIKIIILILYSVSFLLLGIALLFNADFTQTFGQAIVITAMTSCAVMLPIVMSVYYNDTLLGSQEEINAKKRKLDKEILKNMKLNRKLIEKLVEENH